MRPPAPGWGARYGSLVVLLVLLAAGAALIVTDDRGGSAAAGPDGSASGAGSGDGTGGRSSDSVGDGGDGSPAAGGSDSQDEDGASDVDPGGAPDLGPEGAPAVDPGGAQSLAAVLAEALAEIPPELREAVGDDVLLSVATDAVMRAQQLQGLAADEMPADVSAVIAEALTSDNLPASVVAAVLPEGVATPEVARGLGLDIDFGDRCDLSTGLLAIPVVNPPPCAAPFTGDNGGSTAPGVTGETIRIVYWASADDDPVLNFLTESIASDDTVSEVEATLQGLIDYYETYYETYGRRVELHVVEGSGTILDPAAARSDAVRIAEELDPFMVWGGPSLTNAFAEEILARGIACMGCGPGQTSDFYADHDPLAWSVLMGPEQLNLLVADYIAARLAGRPAVHAGDPALASEIRRFGRVYISTSDNAAALHERLKAELAARGVVLDAEVGYSIEPGRIEATATNIIARLKEAGVTTVVLAGDPRVPQTITREATAQNYFPEWVITGTLLTDTNVYGRTYDQRQWAHAFGITPYLAKIDSGVAGASFLYEWFNGEPPPAAGNVSLLNQYPALFYPVLNLMGPDLTHARFAETLLLAQAAPTAITDYSVSFGNKGRWPAPYEPDYFGIDDVVELWWDASAEGPDELGGHGVGMYRYVDGGRRYVYPDRFAAEVPAVFDAQGTSVIYTGRPESEPVGDYAPIAAPDADS